MNNRSETRVGKDEARIILYSGQDTFDLQVLRNEVFLAQFEAAVPFPDARWHPVLKRWRVGIRYLEVTRKIVAEHFEHVSETQG